MLKKIKLYFICLILFFNFVNQIAFASVSIKVKVDNEIITNIDIEKEAEYLKILNPSLNQLNNKKVMKLAKSSLINEIIKKKEIVKFIDINQDNQFVDNYLKEIYLKLNYNSENEFKNELALRNNYTLDEIKKKIKIELFWNELIYSKFKRQLRIDQDKLKEKIQNTKNKKQNEYFLSEIVFSKKKDESLEDLINQIRISINDIGFDNTANIYSISESSKYGGKLDWIKESSLSNLIAEKLKDLKEGEHTDPIKIGNNFLILKINQIKTFEMKVDKKQELQKLIKLETNKQLNQFSRIFFDKSKINYSIYEN